MKGMKKNRLYRIGAGLLAGLLTITAVPQIDSLAQEGDFAAQTEAAYVEDTDLTLEDETAPEEITEDDSVTTDALPEDDDTTSDETPEEAEIQTASVDDAHEPATQADSSPVGSVTIDMSGDGWSDGGFTLERSSTDSSLVYPTNSNVITATIELPEGDATTDIAEEWKTIGESATWTTKNGYVTLEKQARVGNKISVKVTANANAPINGTDTITVHISGTVQRSNPNYLDGDGDPVAGQTKTISKAIDATAECTVTITKLKLRNILLDSTLPDNVTDMKAGGASRDYDVTFVPADADNIGDAAPLYEHTNDPTHVNAELLRPDSTYNGYRLRLQALLLGTADIFVRAGTGMEVVESRHFKVSVSEFEPVPLTGIELRVESAGSGWSEVPSSYEMREGTNKTFRVYYTPANTTEKEVKVTAGSDLLAVQEIAADPNGAYREYQIAARTLTDADTLTNGCADATITVTPQNASGSIAARNYSFKIRKESHPVNAILTAPETLEIKNRGAGSTGFFTVSVAPHNADNREIVLTSDHPIKVRKRGADTYTTIDSSNALTVMATEQSSGGQSAVCGFDVMAADEADTGDVVITARSGDKAFTGSGTVTVTISNHQIENITLSPATLLVHEAPEADYDEAQDLGEIEAAIDPVEAANRKLVWTIAPAAGSAGEARIVGETGLETTLTTEADADTGKTSVRILGLKRGDCVVTATDEETGKVTARCTVRVQTGPYSVASIDLLDGAGEVIDLETIAMRPSSILDLRARVNPTTAINADLTVSRAGTALNVTKEVTTDGITPIHISSNAQENGAGSRVTVRAGGQEKSILVQIKEPYVAFEQRELHYAPDEVSEASIRDDLKVRFYPITALDPESFTYVTDYSLTLITEEGDELTQESANWAGELSKPGEKTLRVEFTHTENGIDTPFVKEITLVVSVYPLVDLVRVINPDKVWNITNGITLNSMTLPTQVDITVRDHYEDSSESDRRMRADVTWNRRSDRYDPDSKEEQNFTLTGTVTLPEGVRNPSGASLEVQVEVNVREAVTAGQKVSKPEFSVENGVTLASGSTIALTCATAGAQIYYTLDGTTATRDGLLYTAPIRPTAVTTVIRAMAYKEGWQDSDPVKIVVYLEEKGSDVTYDPNDPDEPIPDDVTPEDKEQIGGKTEGLWAVIQDVEGREEKLAVFAYTGSALKPAVHVYDGTRLLKEKTDYTVTYKNNKNAGGPGTTDKYPAVIITGKGNYDGKVEVPFVIKPQDITDESVFMDDVVAVAYNKKAQKPAPKLTWNGKTLTKKKDYTYDEVSYKEPGTYQVQVTGVGNYTGTRTLDYEIYDHGVPVSKLTFSKVTDQKYTGNRIMPAMTVKNKNVTLAPGVNYKIDYVNNLNVGTASIVITGKDAYKGSKRINFKILPVAEMKNVSAVLTFDPASPVYEGKAVKPSSYTLTCQGKTLKEGEDFTVSYQNNDKAGTATAVFTGKGPYKGTLKKKFKIGKGSILQASIEMAVSYPYEKGGCKPKPVVIVGDRVLTEGTDYTLSYKNNNKLGNTAQVTVKGKGNYTGSLSKFFAVTMQNISNLQVVAADKVYQPKKNVYKTKVEVYDLNGKKLEADKDYAKDVVYTYASGTKKDQPVLATDIIPAGTRIQVEVRVTKPKFYMGTAYGVYRIVEADVKSAKVKVLDQEYTGRKVRPGKSQIASITLNGVPLSESDYEITGYENNSKQGTAKMTIRGIGSYGGTKTVTFKIKKKGILALRY